MEVWWQSVAASNCQRLKGQVENRVHNTPVVAARESDSSSQLVGSAPQQVGRASGVREVTEARLNTHMGAVQLQGRPPKFQCTTVGEGGSPPPPWTRGHQTLMDTPWQVRLWATGVGTDATEGVERGNGWHP